MKKITLTLASALVLVLVSFSINFTNTTSTVLNDIEGTLLQSTPVIENNNGDFTVTFSVDENVHVSSSLIGDSNEIYLIENGNSNNSKSVTLDLQPVNGKVATAFNNIYENNFDVASMEGLLNAQDPERRPIGVIIWE
ncbi:MAG: hypothetical protein ABFR32_08230 [Bacteroidota bacterium]